MWSVFFLIYEKSKLKKHQENHFIQQRNPKHGCMFALEYV